MDEIQSPHKRRSFLPDSSPPVMPSTETIEPFPTFSPSTSILRNPPNDTQSSPNLGGPERARSNTARSRQSRGQSFVQSFVTSNPPLGMWQATGEVGSKIPTLPEIRDGSFGDEGWSQEGQMEHRGTNPHEIHRRTSRTRRSSASTRTRTMMTPNPTQIDSNLRQEPFPEERADSMNAQGDKDLSQTSHHDSNDKNEKVFDIMDVSSTGEGPDETGTYPNGYRFPRKHTWSQSIAIGLKAFWKFFITPTGFLITIYALNVVGWGAMIFFVLLEAAPAMCHPSCNDQYSARNIWIEIDAQVLTALFCVPAFGLIPWRFRDFYYLGKWRLGGNQVYHRKLAGIYRSWYRLPGSDKLADNIAPPPVYDAKHPQSEDDPPPYSAEDLKALEDNPALPLPATSIPDPPLTGFRAAPTKSWNLDMIIWMYMLNTWIQGALCGIMWGMTRFNRPSWATGFLISIGSITGIIAGIVVFIEGSKIKKTEGIPVKEYDVVESIEDYQKRKAKDDAKEAKKQDKQAKHDGPRVERTEKIKGHSWFTRH